MGTRRGYLLGLALFAAALAARFALNPLLPAAGFPFLTFFPAVLLATYLGGLGPGLLVTALSAFSASYFFMPPFGSFAVATAADGIALGVFVLILLTDVAVVHALTLALRRAEAERARNEALAAELHALNATLEDRVRTEVAAREAAQNRLAQDQRLRALGQLAGGISHDFNNIMQAVQSGAGLIARRAGDPQAVRHLARMVEDAALRGASVTRRLLAFARQAELRAERIEPGALLLGLKEVLTHTLGAGITVRTEVAPHLPALQADRGQLETVLVNLATNARDAMPTGGTLTIAAAAETVGARGKHPADLDPGHYVRLAVADTGTGMAPEVLARAGEPFFSTKAAGAGTGLGLAMARGFAEQSSGALAIDSTWGRGTRVTLWLPVPLEPALVGLPEPATGATRGRLLLVDDDDLVRQFLVAGLTERGFQVLEATGGEAALSLLAAGGPADLLVTDFAMPGMDGVALAEAIGRRWPERQLPGIILTGNVELDLEARLAGRPPGAPPLRLLRKPVAIETLVQQIAAELGRVPA